MLMDRVYNIRIQHNRLIAELRIKSGIAEPDSEDSLDAIVEGEDLDKALDYVVETGAESTCGKDADSSPVRIMIDLGMRTGALKTRLTAKLLREIFHDRAVLRHKYAVSLIDEVIVADRRSYLTFAQTRHIPWIKVGICKYLLKSGGHM